MEGLIILLAIVVGLGLPGAAIAGLVMGLSARGRIEALKARVDSLESDVRLLRARADQPPPEAAPAPAAPEPEPAAAAPEPTAPEPEPALPPSAVPPIPAPPPRPAAQGQDFEEKLGTRWAVWVGGVALALGGIFLVRYSIEQGLLNPTTRIALGFLFALALIGAGEWLRRRERGVTLAAIPNANIPSILTAAGTSTAFATAYAAYALYDLIGPAATFVILGAIAVLTMVAATLHGPALAALGLVAALGSPFLVSSDRPQPWALVIYIAFVVLAAYGVARLRLWRWLALAAAAGALAWTFPIFVLEPSNVLPAMVHLALQTGFAAFFLVIDPYRNATDEDATIDWPASLALLAFALAGILVSSSIFVGGARPVFVTALALILLATGLRFAPAAAAAAWAALVAAGALFVWPIRTALMSEPENLFYLSGDPFAVQPDALATYLTLAALLPPAVAGASLLRLARAERLRPSLGAWYAGAATVGPVLALVAAYWRIAAFERSLSFALVAGVLALAYAGAAAWLTRQGEMRDTLRLALGAAATAALASIAFGLTFALEKGMLTVAFALTALAAAWVADRIALPALRYAVAGIGVIVLARLAWDPAIVQGHPGPILVNWILWGYGVPAVSFLLASRIMERTGRDRIVQLTESLGIVFATFLVFFEIRHALYEGNPLAEDFGLLEAGLLATQSLLFAIVLRRLDLSRTDPVYRYGAMIFRILSFVISIGGLLLIANPLFNAIAISGGVVFNTLIPAYLIPSLLAAALAYVERDVRPRAYAMSSAILSLVLQWAYVALEIRRIFQGPQIDRWREITQGEQWSYSVALLVIGLVLLLVGLIRDNRFARLASAVYLVAAVLKVFIVDLANLEGVMRAFSFIGLGAVLIGIGLVYQRLLARRPGDAVTPS